MAQRILPPGTTEKTYNETVTREWICGLVRGAAALIGGVHCFKGIPEYAVEAIAECFFHVFVTTDYIKIYLYATNALLMGSSNEVIATVGTTTNLVKIVGVTICDWIGYMLVQVSILMCRLSLFIPDDCPPGGALKVPLLAEICKTVSAVLIPLNESLRFLVNSLIKLEAALFESNYEEAYKWNQTIYSHTGGAYGRLPSVGSLFYSCYVEHKISGK